MNFTFNPMAFIENLQYMGIGMLVIFVVIGIIILTTMLINWLFLQVATHHDLATREDDEHTPRIDMRRNLLVEHLQEVGKRHILLRHIYPAIATTMTTRQITTKRTLPKECTQLMMLDSLIVEPLEEFESEIFAQT